MARDALMDQLYPDLLKAHLTGEYRILDHSLNPRPPMMLLDLAAKAGLEPSQVAVDVGCGRGDYVVEMARRFGCRALGLDLAMGGLQLAEATDQDRELSVRVLLGQGNIEALPVSSGAADLILCRDMLLHVADLDRGMAECSRVLRPGGSLIVLATIAGDLLCQEEAEALFEPLGIASCNLSRDTLEAAFAKAGLTIQQEELLGGERLEYYEEQYGYYSRELMRLSRMRRDRHRYLPILGQRRYELAMALYTLSIYLLIGKLDDIVYWLVK